MRLKPGVRILGVKPEAVVAQMIVGSVYEKRGHELEITSGGEGKHRSGSIHYQGLAFDCGIKDPTGTRLLPMDERLQLASAIREALDGDFDVVLEEDHIHVEFQPKKPL